MCAWKLLVDVNTPRSERRSRLCTHASFAEVTKMKLCQLCSQELFKVLMSRYSADMRRFYRNAHQMMIPVLAERRILYELCWNHIQLTLRGFFFCCTRLSTVIYLWWLFFLRVAWESERRRAAWRWMLHFLAAAQSVAVYWYEIGFYCKWTSRTDVFASLQPLYSYLWKSQSSCNLKPSSSCTEE